MKYIFFGTPRFAEIVLRNLLDADMPPVALVCNPDRPVGRKKIVMAPATKVLAEKYNARGAANGGTGAGAAGVIEILQPEKIDDDFLTRLRALAPDFAIVAAYGKILPQAVLDIPGRGVLGVHPSLLPKYRGASPIQSAILAGEPETGTTIYLMDEKTDHGPILTQTIFNSQFPIFNVPYLELEEALAKLGAELLQKIIPDVLHGKTRPEPQDDARATYTRKFTTQDAFITSEDLVGAECGDEKKARAIAGKINAFNPEPGAWTIRGGARIKLFGAKLDGNRLVILETQKEGERAGRRTG